MDSDGNNIVRLTDNNFYDGVQCWSPMEIQIVFETLRDGNSVIYSMDSSGGNVGNLTNNPDYDGEPSRGPQKIAFSSSRSGQFEIYTSARMALG